jgi:hypothetical protein
MCVFRYSIDEVSMTLKTSLVATHARFELIIAPVIE